MTALIPRATIDQIDGYRRQALDLYGKTYDLLGEAWATARLAVPSGLYGLADLRVNRDDRHSSRDEFVEAVRKQLDRSIWHHLIQATSLDSLMDKKAKDEFRAQVEKNPPPATADNCYATMEQLVSDADLIFKRGVANAFSGLDRRFRSHDGFKIGTRIVLSYFAGADGYVRWDGKREVLIDVERAFYVLDKKPQPDPDAGILGKIKLAKTGGVWGAEAYQAEDAYFRVKVFKNGNAHVWFKRDDLVERVNLILADYYGATLGAGAHVAEQTHEAKRTPAKNFGFFRSPEAVVARVLESAGVHDRRRDWRGSPPAPLRVLEPNAGDGAIAGTAARFGHEVTAVEIQARLADQLVGQGLQEIVRDDFFDQLPAALGLFDVVVMNPPFDGGRDIDHVVHAMKFLRPGGRLVSVMSSSTEFREDRKTADFRQMVERYRGGFSDLPAGSFSESGTNVNTIICKVSLPGAA